MKKWLICFVCALLLCVGAMAEDTAPQTAAMSVAVQGSDQLESVLVPAFNAWVSDAVPAEGIGNSVLALSKKAPVATLLSSNAIKTDDELFSTAPGTAGGLSQAADALILELIDAGAPFKSGFVFDSFTLNNVQSMPAENGSVAADTAMLMLMYAGKRQEGPAYTLCRFFTDDGVIVWLTDDVQILQTCAQMNLIRANADLSLNMKKAAGWSNAGLSYVPGEAVPEAQEDDEEASEEESEPSSEEYVYIPQYITVTSDGGASIREQPQQSAKRIATAKKGTQLEFISVTDFGWIMVYTQDREPGYIHPKLVGPLPGQEEGQYIIATKEITIHEKPSYNCNEPGTARKGNKYYVVSDKVDGWLQIRLKDGSIGYIATSNTKPVK